MNPNSHSLPGQRTRIIDDGVLLPSTISKDDIALLPLLGFRQDHVANNGSPHDVAFIDGSNVQSTLLRTGDGQSHVSGGSLVVGRYTHRVDATIHPKPLSWIITECGILHQHLTILQV